MIKRKLSKTNRSIIFKSALVTSMIFIIDLLTPLGIAVGVLYIFALFLMVRIKDRFSSIIRYFAIGCSLLTLISIYMHWPSDSWMALANRGISLLAIWGTSLLIIYFKKVNEEDRQKLQALKQEAYFMEERKKNAIIFRQIVNAAPNALVLINQKGEIILINNQVEQLLGFPRKELLGKLFEEFLPKRFYENHPTFKSDIFKNSEYRPMGRGQDLYVLRKDGTEVPVEVNLNPLTIDIGKTILVSIVDITSRKNQENTIKQQLFGLKELNQELENFTYVLTHDLRQPLKNMANLSGLIREDYADNFDEEGDKILRLIEKNANKVDNLIVDMLNYTKSSKQDFKKETVDLNTLFYEEFEIGKELYKQKSISFKMEKLPLVLGDKTALRQVCQNLVSNALKYSSKQEKIEITISFSMQENKPTFSIKDNGAGFDEKLSHKIFEVFQRLHKESDFSGTGIGMPITAKIINKHNGKIWAKSSLGAGAIFYFTLPICA